MKTFDDYGISIYNDRIETFTDIPDNSIDLTVTSPPYNVNMPYATYQDKLPYDQYLHWCSQWLSRIYDLTKSDGRLCINIPVDIGDGSKGMHCICNDYITIARKIGWQYHRIIVWDKGVSNKTSRGVFMSAAAPRRTFCFEVVLVFFKDQWEKFERRESDMSRGEFLDYTDGIWKFNGESNPRHPAVFPLEMPRRCIKLFSFIGDTVLEPFCGTGTTLVAAAHLNRKAIGIDIDSKYCAIAKRRLQMHTHIGKAGLLKQAGSEAVFKAHDGISNASELAAVKEARKSMTVRVHGIKRFLK